LKDSDPRTPEGLNRSPVDLIGCGLLSVAIIALLVRLVAVRGEIEGVDFYYYVVNARDLLDKVGGSSDARFIYFPGVYMFWAVALWIGGGSLSALQWVYAGVLIANALLIGLLIRSVTRHGMSALAGAALYLALAGVYEGFYAATEPIATMAALVGLLAWTDRAKVDCLSKRRILVCCIGFGLALLMKQQAVLLVTGVPGSALSNRLTSRPTMPRREVALVGLGSLAVFLLGILMQGYGLRPLRRSFEFAVKYVENGSLNNNVWPVVLRAPGLFVGVLVSAAVLAVYSLRERPTGLHSTGIHVATVCSFAGVASMWQFSRRPYLHYMLLGLPFFIAAIMIVVDNVVTWARECHAFRARTAAYGVSAVVLTGLVLTLLSAANAANYGKAWRRQPQVAADLSALSRYVRPGDELAVAPSRRNDIHLELGTVSTLNLQGYAWYAPVEVAALIDHPDLERVLIVAPMFRDATDAATCALARCDDAGTALVSAGFVAAVELRSMTLWQRRSLTADSSPPDALLW